MPDKKAYRRECLLGALGAFLMLVGDLCLSIIAPKNEDSGLFARAFYLSRQYESWRFPLLIVTGLLGMALGVFWVRMLARQVLPQYKNTRQLLTLGGVLCIASAAAIHVLIGSLADWTSTLGPILGAEKTMALISEQFSRILPALFPGYFGLALVIVVDFWAVLTRRTILPRRMALCHMLVFLLLFAGIPDLRQALGCDVSTWDYVLSQGSGNAALLIWMLERRLGVQRKKYVSVQKRLTGYR